LNAGKTLGELEKEKVAWLKAIRMYEHPQPVKYFYMIDYCTFSFTEDYIKNTPLEELKAEYEKNKQNITGDQKQ